MSEKIVSEVTYVYNVFNEMLNPTVLLLLLLILETKKSVIRRDHGIGSKLTKTN